MKNSIGKFNDMNFSYNLDVGNLTFKVYINKTELSINNGNYPINNLNLQIGQVFCVFNQL